jgi:hypothetical protein
MISNVHTQVPVPSPLSLSLAHLSTLSNIANATAHCSVIVIDFIMIEVILNNQSEKGPNQMERRQYD